MVVLNRIRRALFSALAIASLAGASSGCAALFPEMSTEFSEAPDMALDPPPPTDRHYLKVLGGTVPPKTRDGRDWDQAFGSLPDPVATINVNGKELLKTVTDSDTLEPKWAGSPTGNFRIQVGDEIEVQMWDANTIGSTPIGVRKLTLTQDMISTGEVTFDLSGGAQVRIAIEPARAIWGVGFWFELRNDSSYVSRVIDGSPATRAGIQQGDRILQIDGKDVSAMSTGEVQSAFKSIPAAGRVLTLQHAGGGTLQATIKRGPIYPFYEDYRQLPVLPKE